MLTVFKHVVGTAEILGSTRQIAYQDGTLTIENLTYQEAVAVLAGVTGARDASPEPPLEHPPHGVIAAERKLQNLPPEEAKRGRGRPPKGAAPVVEYQEIAPPKVERLSVQKDRFVDDEDLEDEDDLPFETPAEQTNGVPAILKTAQTVREIVAWFVSHEIHDENKIVAECERWQDQIPVLAKVGGSIRNRVKILLSSMI